MSGVSRIGGPSGPATTPRRPGPGGFQVGGTAAQPAGAAGPAAPVGLAALLALQDEQERPRDRAARRHARDLLAGLDALHKALLGAGSGGDGLARLARLVDAMPDPADDPDLRDAVADIRLRARVELARYMPNGSATNT